MVIYKYLPLKNDQLKKHAHVPAAGQPSALPPPANRGAAPGLLGRVLVSTASSTLRSPSALSPPAGDQVTGGQIIYVHVKWIVCPQGLILTRHYIMGIQKSFI